MAKRVIIIGCGFAGAAAAAVCAERFGEGIETLVLESRPRPGGRASSFYERDMERTLDNGQHLLMGCYHATLRLLATLGTRYLLEEQNKFCVEFLAPGGEKTSLASVPMHLGNTVGMLAGILVSNHFSIKERISLISALSSIRRIGRIRPLHEDDKSIADLLHDLHQGESLLRKFWDPLVIAVMNNTAANASAALLIEVCNRAFFGNSANARLLMPNKSLSELLAPIGEYVQVRNGSVRFGATGAGDSYRARRSKGRVARLGRVYRSRCTYFGCSRTPIKPSFAGFNAGYSAIQ